MSANFQAVGIVSVILALPCLAQAHISLDAPLSRYYLTTSNQADQTKLKLGPCGVTGDKRTTNPALVTTFKPGETITVTWRETVQHPGHFRLAFDSDGQDFGLPGAASPSGAVVLADAIADRSGANGLVYEQQVTLPNIECSNCTLQLIQIMTTAGPPYAAGDLYFNCADLVLRVAGGGTGTGGTAAGSLGGRGGSASGTGGSPASGGVVLSSGGRPGGVGGSTPMGGNMTGGSMIATGGSPVSGGGASTMGGSPVSGGGTPTTGGNAVSGGTKTNAGAASQGGVTVNGGRSASGGEILAALGGAATLGGESHRVPDPSAGIGAGPASGTLDTGCSCQLFRHNSGPSGALFALIAIGALRRRHPTKIQSVGKS